MTMIKDGEGGGYMAGVTSEKRLKIAGVTSSIEHHINHEYGKAFNMMFNETAAGADDCIVYMKNTDSCTMTIEGIYIYVAGAVTVTIKTGASGTRNGAVTNVPAVLNAGATTEANGDFETGSDLAGGSATLDGTEIEVFKFRFSGETDTKYFNFDQDIIVPQNQTITVWLSAAVEVDGMIPFNYHSDEAYA